MDYIVKILRTLFFNIDKVVYEGIGNVYDLLLRIARTTILDSADMQATYKKIYALIGIFMLFKISLSLINYILNPDDFVDKEKGFSSIMKRVVISLVMLVLFPYAFKEAYALQTIILEDNVLASLVFNDVNVDATYSIDTAGDKIKFILMYTFFQPNYNEIYESDIDESIASCAVTYQYASDGKVDTVDGNIYLLNSECFGSYDSSNGTYDGGAFLPYWSNENLFQTYAQGVSRQNFHLIFRSDIMKLTIPDNKEVYVINYQAPLSTAVGVATFWILLMFCIDVAVRSVKLAFFELIAPIPILSYIDPKSKDGMFSKWLKQCGVTYASLFLRLLALYLAIYLISVVSSSGIKDVITGERVTDWWVLIFVIIGVLMFAKQLPKILEDALGIKGTGDFKLNPLKNLEENAIGGKLISGVGKKAIGTAKGVGTAALVGGAAFATGQGIRFGAMGKAVAGGFKGEKFGKNFASSYGAGRARKKELDQMESDGVSPWSVRAAKAYNAFHGETKAEHQKAVSEKMEAVTKTWDDVKGTVTAVDKEAKNLKALEEGIKAGGVTAYHDMQRTVKGADGRDVIDPVTGKAKTETYTAAQQYADAVKAAGDALDRRVNDIATGRATINDGTADGSAGGAAAAAKIASLNATMDALIGEINTEGISYTDANGASRTVNIQTRDANGDRIDIKNVAKGMQGEMGAWKSSKEYTSTEDVAKYTGGSKK